jgi:hypothetical protein
MAEAAAAPSALPYVSWTNATFALIPSESWSTVYASMQALKGHIQEYPGLQRFDVYAHIEEEDTRIHCYTTWDTPEQLAAFLERGYTVERMLADTIELDAEASLSMEKIF